MQINQRPWTGAPVAICHFINHAARANSVFGKINSLWDFIRQCRQEVHTSGWLKWKLQKRNQMLRDCQQLLCCSSKFISTENTAPEMRGDEEVVMSSWSKRRAADEMIRVFLSRERRDTAHNQRPWNQAQSHSRRCLLIYIDSKTPPLVVEICKDIFIWTICLFPLAASLSVSLSLSQTYIFLVKCLCNI